MFWYTMESFRRTRGLIQLDYSTFLGFKRAYYTNNVRGGRPPSSMMYNTIMKGNMFTVDEKVLLEESIKLMEASDSRKRKFKRKVDRLEVMVQRDLNRNSPHRIRNIPGVYALLSTLEDDTKLNRLQGVEPNHPTLRKLRKAIGEVEYWDNPFKPQAKGDNLRHVTKDRREATEMYYRVVPQVAYYS